MNLLSIILLSMLSGTSTAGMLPGGWDPVQNLDSAEMHKVIDFSVEKISSESNSLYHLRSKEILKARKQVVSGKNYQFKAVRYDSQTP